jgi:hypothetical protein
MHGSSSDFVFLVLNYIKLGKVKKQRMFAIKVENKLKNYELTARLAFGTNFNFGNRWGTEGFFDTVFAF